MTKEEAIKVIDNRYEIMDYCESVKLEEALDIAIESLKQSRWIPCSERMPKQENEERRGFFLTTNVCGSVGISKYEFCGDFGFVGWGDNRPSDIRIVAWMPLPEPYGGEQE